MDDSTVGQADFYIKQGDRSPIIEGTLLEPNGKPANLTGITVVRFIANQRQGRKKISGNCVIVEPRTVTVAGVVVGTGLVRYLWASGDTNVPGAYDFEFVSEPGEANQRSYPNFGNKELQVLAGLKVPSS